MISNSNAVSTNADLNNVFNCITQKANARQDLVLSDAFICYDHNLKGASKFANKPFQNPDLSNLGIKPAALSTTNTATDKTAGSSPDKTDSKKNPSTDSTTDNTLTKTNSKTATAATDKPTADTTGAHDNQGIITDPTGNHKKDTKSPSTADDPFAKAAGDSSTSSSSKTQPNKGKPDATSHSPSSSSSKDDPFAKAAGDSSTSSSSKTQPNKGKPDINPTSKEFQSFDLPFSVIMPE